MPVTPRLTKTQLRWPQPRNGRPVKEPNRKPKHTILVGGGGGGGPKKLKPMGCGCPLLLKRQRAHHSVRLRTCAIWRIHRIWLRHMRCRVSLSVETFFFAMAIQNKGKWTISGTATRLQETTSAGKIRFWILLTFVVFLDFRYTDMASDFFPPLLIQIRAVFNGFLSVFNGFVLVF